MGTITLLRHIVLGVLLASFNFVSSLINIYYLYKEDHILFGTLDLLLLWFPGMVLFLSLVFLYKSDDDLDKLSVPQFWLMAFGILIFCPLVPIVLTVAYLVTKNEKIHENARLSKCYAGFLDHGPHFVLRLVIVTLIGISQNGVYQRDDFIFIFSMFTSFLAFILTALFFNERKSNMLKWIFLSGPMYSAIFACRAFTLAVYLKETLYNNKTDAPWALFILLIMFSSNIGLFRYCGQDWLRSVVFGTTSLLVPSGFKNDSLYYQIPHQDIGMDQSKVYTVPARPAIDEANAINEDSETEKEHVILKPMRSTKFFLLHVIFNTLLMFSVSVYLFTSSSDLDTSSDDALVIPQLLGVVPGLLFSISYCFTLDDCIQVAEESETRIQACCGRLQKSGKFCLAVLFSGAGYLSLIPALFWTFIYKWFTSVDVTKAIVDYTKD